MSEIRVTNIIGENGSAAVNFSKGINISSGIVTATTFSGSGASLTSIPAANLTGTLPAISGANLTGVGGGLQSQQVFTSSGTWNKPSGITKVKVFVTGGGGGGSGVGGNQYDDAGQGGAAGGTAIKIIDVSSISSVTVTIGAAGQASGTQAADGGDGGTSLASGDFDNIDYSTVYTDEIDNWVLANSPTFNEFTLTSTALTDIKNNDAFIIAIVNHTSDYLDQDTSDGVFANAINFSGITIDYTLAPTGYGNNVIGIPSANISTVNAVATANIEKIISV